MANPPFRVKAVFDYSSEHDDDLKFSIGQIITVTDEEDDDWYFGEYVDADGEAQQGLFPRNFVERYEPTTPPRPSKAARPRREPEAEREPPREPGAEHNKPTAAAVREHEQEEAEQQQTEVTKTKELDAPPAITSDLGPDNTKDVEASESQLSPAPAQLEQSSAPSPLPAASARSPPAPSVQMSAAKTGPPPVANKPAVSSFRDRIAAFNQPAAAAVPPPKPGQPSNSSFVKKPYVPPPPSKDAYVRLPPEVPAAKIYKAHEDPDAHGIPAKEDRRPSMDVAETEDQPKPTSLKERIALLQKQQLEQAARYAEAAQKKEKPKKPPKKRSEPHPEAAVTREPALERTISEDTNPENINPASVPPKLFRHISKDETPVPSPHTGPQEFLSDPNDADQLAGGDTEDGEPLGTQQRLNKAQISAPIPQIPKRTNEPLPRISSENMERDSASANLAPPEETEEQGADEEDEDAAEEEEDVDPEVKRRMEIRDRMAKMSGGMGMAGMFGAVPGGMPRAAPKKTKTSSDSHKKHSTEDVAASSSPPSQPMPVMGLPGMSMPGISRVKTPEPMEAASDVEDDRLDEEESSQAQSEKEKEVAQERLKEKLRSPPPPPGSLLLLSQ